MLEPMDLAVKVEPLDVGTDFRFMNGEREVENGMSDSFTEFPVDIDFSHDDVEKRHSCLVCKKQFDSKAQSDSHVVYSECGGGSLPVFICKLCEQHFTSRQNLQEHIFVHIVVDPNETENYVINCQNCNRAFGRSTELALHIRTGDCTHPSTLQSSSIQESQLITTPRDNIINPVISQPVLLFLQQGNCLTTAVSANSPTAFPASSSSSESKKVEKPFRHKCKECNRCFRLAHHLEWHSRVHSGGGSRNTSGNIGSLSKDVGTAETDGVTVKKRASDDTEEVSSEEQGSPDAESEVEEQNDQTISAEIPSTSGINDTAVEMTLQADLASNSRTDKNTTKTAPEKRKRRHWCHQCAEDFSSIADLERHQAIHTRYKRIAPKNSAPQPIVNIWFSGPTETENASQQDSSEEKSSKIYKFVCEFCYKNFKYSHHLRDHVVARHTKDYSQFHQCELCKKRFRVPKGLYKHLKMHHDVTVPFPCEHCIMTFVKVESLNQHLAEKHGVVNTTEPICNRTNEDKSMRDEARDKPDSDDLASRLTDSGTLKDVIADLQCLDQARNAPQSLAVDGSDTETVEKCIVPYKFPCKYCHKKFKYTSHLRDHVINLHTKDYSQFRHICDLCAKRFRVPKELVTHLQRFHGISTNLRAVGKHGSSDGTETAIEDARPSDGEPSTTKMPENNPNLIIRVANADKFTCKYCGKRFKYTHHLRDHVSSKHTKDFSYFRHRCNVCDQRFRVPSLLAAHLKLHHFQCEHCSNEFVTVDKLSEHLAEMHGGVTVTSRKTKVSAQAAVVTSETDRSGETMPEIMNASDNMAESKSVEETNTADENIRSNNCEALFPDEEDMDDEHYLSESDSVDANYEELDLSDENNSFNYTCQYCDKKFRHTQHLRGHIIAKHKRDFDCFRHVCEICEQRFRVPSEVYAHLKSQHDIAAALQCDKCTLRFVKPDNLTIHLDEVHNQDSNGSGKVTEEYVCKVCDKRFLSKPSLRCHVARYHQGSAPSEKYACPYCKKQFRTLYFVKIHVKRVHNKERSHMCVLCDKAFYKRNELLDHIRFLHEDFKPYDCKLCGKRYAIISSLTKHVVDVHGEGNNEAYVCKTCDKTFKSKLGFDIHTRRFHSDDSILDKYSCPHCAKEFNAKYHMNEHVRRVHLKLKPHKCTECTKAFCRPYELFEHLKVHSEISKPLECMHCNKKFALAASLNEHYAREHENESAVVMDIADDKVDDDADDSDSEIVGCQFCGKTFKGRNSLGRHIERLHLDDLSPDKNVCPYCERSFRSRCDLKMHIKRVHLVEKDYKCDGCPKSFVTLYELRVHRVIHTDGIRLVCTICNRKFKTVEILKRHEKLHRGDTSHLRHMCEFCGLRRRTPRELQIHIRSHTREKPFQCEFCGKAFATLSGMQKHKVTHTKERNYKCTLCDKEYGHVGSLKKHFKAHHKDVDYNKMAWSAPRVQRQPQAEPNTSSD